MIVFAGPSIVGVADQIETEIDLRPPVQQGDVFLACLENPAAIGIIDGFFEGVPSVWHKEILWALSQGVAVLGAASMGALRAAELDVFGMQGVGNIYQAFRDGVLEDDDEVALLHGPAEVGYPALNLAMVNARATLEAAATAGVITMTQAQYATDLAKSQFYKVRTWESVFEAVGSANLSPDKCRELRDWVRHHEVDQKQQDAAELLARLSEMRFDAPTADFHFEETDLWLNAIKNWRRRAANTPIPKGGGYRLFGD
ncbi:TfuA-like protein [Roseobacter sp. EG26]